MKKELKIWWGVYLETLVQFFIIGTSLILCALHPEYPIFLIFGLIILAFFTLHTNYKLLKKVGLI